MLSIIICSINPDYLSAITISIDQTIGVPYELIAFNNKNDSKGITTVYNQGVAKAKYEHLCFVHEDVNFCTNEWGKKIIEQFKDTDIGLIGVAGSKYKAMIPSGWRPGTTGRFTKINMIQHFKYSNKTKTHQNINSENESLSHVACIDGLFFASRKSILQKIPFDEVNLKGFHGYDVDISIAIGQHYKVAVTYDILLEHLSEGNLNAEWITSTLVLHEKWGSKLPIVIGEISKIEKMRLEIRTFKNFLKICKKFSLFPKAFYALELSGIKKSNYLAYLRMRIMLFNYYPHRILERKIFQ
ncbi:glycosyltransferase [Anditalea andensis]|uniref:Streptomycin biosynthesis protein StrF domain-containing protein n=1 Tax=Anditalea andensis TaxID=1048983 RepID=A0A074L623_9BACT|nr:glycosyltransferase [Anditalea andensis]KEO75288.1 hypothetical protein EL17_01740 [Anditalea andensis]